jgi:Flp pilus assembly protein TadD
VVDTGVGPAENYAFDGHRLLSSGESAAAETHFREAVRLEPGRADYHAGLGQALLGQKHYEVAEMAFDEAVELQPDNAAYLAGQGQARLGQGNYSGAERAYRRAASLEPDEAGYHAGLGQALLSQDLYGAAEEAFRKAHDLEPGNAAYSTGLDRARLGRERYAEAARAILDDSGRTEPGEVQLAHDRPRLGRRRYIGRTLPGEDSYHQPDIESLAEEFAGTAVSGPGSVRALADAGHALLAQRRYAEAEDAFRQALSLKPGRAEYKAGLGHALLGLERYRDAGEELRAAVTMAPDRPDYLAALGRAHLAQRYYSEAEAAYGKAARLAPGNPDYLCATGQARLGQRHFGEAEAAFRKALGLQPGSTAAIAGLGNALLGQQRYDEAEALFARAAELEPDNPENVGNLAHALLGKGRFTDAEGAFREAIALAPARAEYQGGLGEALLGQGQFTEAAGAFAKAIELEPTAYHHAGLGHANAGREQYSEAAGNFRAAATLEPGNLQYRSSLGKALLCAGRIEDAEAVLGEAIALDPGANETVSLRQAIAEAYDDEILAHTENLARKALESAARPDITTIDSDRYLNHVRALTEQNLSGLRGPFREWLSAVKGRGSDRAVPVWRRTAQALAWRVEGILVRRAEEERARRRSSRLPAGLLRERLDTLISDLVLEPAITAALGVVWRDAARDIVAIEDGATLSTKAEPDNFVPTDAFNHLTTAVYRHHGAAVGLAGPRGSGKTELARAITELGLQRSSTKTIAVMLWAPVQYSSETFLLRLLKELCITTMLAGTGAADSRASVYAVNRRRTAIAVFVAIVFVLTGSLLILTRFVALHLHTVIPIAVGAMLVLGGILAVVLNQALLAQRRSRAAVGASMKQATIDLAAELRSRAEFTETYTSGATVGLSARSFTANATSGTQLARVPLNEIDVVRELRTMVQLLADDEWRVVIAIDELDKIADQQEAITFLNHIKVLFPINDCSFIVSVSEDAWANFEYRGLPMRDAFDSSFDEIVLVDMLRPQESRDLLKRRCRDVTDAQALLCHCLSGGLPRDLLRCVRLMARTAASLKASGRTPTPALSDVLDRIISEDIAAKIAAARNSSIERDWNPSDMSYEQLMSWVDAQCSGITPDAPNGKMIAAYVSFLHTIREAFSADGPLNRLDGELGFSHPLITDGFDLIAQARRNLASNMEVAYQLLDRARRTLELQPISPDWR